MSFIVWVWLLGLGLAVAALLVAARSRKLVVIGSEFAAGVLLASFPLIYAAPLSLWVTVAGTVLHLWLLLLPARLYMGRLEPQFLRRSTEANALAGLALAVALVTAEIWYTVVLAEWTFLAGLFVALVVALYFMGQLLWNMRHYRLKNGQMALSATPTVSVCIPARNEDHALADCLQAVLASDYPKLEVLVLDDCSQDKTSSIIKSFAHDGVRFVQGDQPALGWLGKNQAMQTLASHASGDYLLFIDVDTHVSAQTVSQLMNYMLTNKLDMVSVMPQNRLGLSTSTVFSTLDHFWRIIMPITKKHMPVTGKCWLIKRMSLDGMGGFASVSRKIIPEESFARRLFAAKAYRFLVGNKALGLTTAKRWSSQVQTTLRLSYPLLHRQPLVSLGTMLLLAGLFIVPLILLATEALQGHTGVMFALAAATTGLLVLDYYLVLVRTHPKTWLITGLLWPFAILQEMVIVAASMLLYEFAEVNWKGRNVCYPVLLPRPPEQGPRA